jgi:hypothetical protein
LWLEEINLILRSNNGQVHLVVRHFPVVGAILNAVVALAEYALREEQWAKIKLHFKIPDHLLEEA